MQDSDGTKWKTVYYGTVEITWPESGVWGVSGGTYIFFHDHATGREGEIHDKAANMLFAYMGGMWEPLIGWRLKNMGSFMGGDCSAEVLAEFKEDETDRIDMMAMQMESLADKWKKEQETKRIQKAMLDAIGGLQTDVPPKHEMPEFVVEQSKRELKELLYLTKGDIEEMAKLERAWVNWLFESGEENVQASEPKVQSQVWQKQFGLRSTAPNFSEITSFTTQDSKPKLSGG
jgi:hypothetical protein